MIPKSPHRWRQQLLPFGSSALGDGLPERLRSTSLAILGVIGAAALAMVGLTLQSGAPSVSSGPIHEPIGETRVSPAQAVAVQLPAVTRERPAPAKGSSETIPSADLSIPESRPEPAAEAPVSSPVVVAVPAPPERGREGGSDRGTDDHQQSSPEVPVDASPPPPPAAPVEEPIAMPSSESPEVAAPELPQVEATSHPGGGNAYGKGSGKGPQGAGPPGLSGK